MWSLLGTGLGYFPITTSTIKELERDKGIDEASSVHQVLELDFPVGLLKSCFCSVLSKVSTTECTKSGKGLTVNSKFGEFAGRCSLVNLE